MHRRPQRTLPAHDPQGDLQHALRSFLPQLALPLFITEGTGQARPLPSLPDQWMMSLDMLLGDLNQLRAAGAIHFVLFGVPAQRFIDARTACGSGSLIAQALRSLRQRFPEISLTADLCLCQYTPHAECGVIDQRGVDNDKTLKLLCALALEYAAAGASALMPSGMIDGCIAQLRSALDACGFQQVALLPQSAKFSSALYGPFRGAAHAAHPALKESYQLDGANSLESLRAIDADLKQGAKLVIIKPALSNLDVIHEARKKFGARIGAFCTGGEYQLVGELARINRIPRERAILEYLNDLHRAGADLIVSYFGREIALA